MTIAPSRVQTLLYSFEFFKVAIELVVHHEPLSPLPLLPHGTIHGEH